MNELHFSHNIIVDKLKRQKNKKETLIHLYPHRDSVLQCFYFSLAYRALMLGDDDDYIFPQFAKRAANQTEDKSDSKVSSLWSSNFGELSSPLCAFLRN